MVALPAGARIGILGGGQLGRMLAQAAGKFGYHVDIYEPEADAPAAEFADRHIRAAYDDRDALQKFSAAVDVITYEFENVPAATAMALAKDKPLFPAPRALQVAQDRWDEKTFIADLDIPVAAFYDITSKADLQAAHDALGGDGILKTRRGGYDGKGQWRLQTSDERDKAWQALENHPAILEACIPFDMEISVIVVRGQDGQVESYTPAENIHRDHILYQSIVPARIPKSRLEEARSFAAQLVTALDYIGVLGVEFFVTPTQLLINEIAPRVHNSGHWTLSACVVSQFENHIRAITGLPLGSTRRHSNAVMTNILGDDMGDMADWVAKENCDIHLYGKTEARAKRKMGHVTEIFPI